uniref:Uncharacterized protein n=1 Tax=Romanomermis culicivorax TaxID=13658 RepID=A0A915K926_ROMCU
MERDQRMRTDMRYNSRAYKASHMDFNVGIDQDGSFEIVVPIYKNSAGDIAPVQALIFITKACNDADHNKAIVQNIKQEDQDLGLFLRDASDPGSCCNVLMYPVGRPRENCEWVTWIMDNPAMVQSTISSTGRRIRERSGSSALVYSQVSDSKVSDSRASDSQSDHNNHHNNGLLQFEGAVPVPHLAQLVKVRGW